MKNYIVSFILVSLFISANAQDYAAVENFNVSAEEKSSTFKRLEDFSSEILGSENFNYRALLKSAKKSKTFIRFSGEKIARSEFLKQLRNSAKQSKNSEEFRQHLNIIYPDFKNRLSAGKSTLLYNKFKKGTVSAYLQDLEDNW